MKITTILVTAFFATISLASNDQQVEFLTAFVSDFASHRRQYVDYFMTARNVPAEITKIAREVVTCKDDSYTTLVNDDDINLTSLVSFATNLPWYSRIQAAVFSASDISGGSETTGESSTARKTSTFSGGGDTSILISGGALIGAAAVLLI